MAHDVFISGVDTDIKKIEPILRRLKQNGWNLTGGSKCLADLSLPVQDIENCDILLAFISATYITDRESFVSELSYAACALRKLYILVMLEDMDDLPPDLEMLAAKDGFVNPDEIEIALENRLNPSTKEPHIVTVKRRYAYKPFEACEENYAFISYAHDDALTIYPIIKDLYEAGWNLWYDQGIRITERYLPEIARHVRDCEVFLLFVTECSVGRPFVIDFELAYAKKLKKKIVPVMVDLVKQMPEGTENLAKAAPDESLTLALERSKIKNYGKRTAVPPKDKKEEEYDLAQLLPMKNYKYQLSGDGLVLRKYTGNEKNVIVPGEHCGLPVRGLSGTFCKQRGIDRIVIPESVQYIGRKTFRYCKATVEFPHPKQEYTMEDDNDEGDFGGQYMLSIVIAMIIVIGAGVFWVNDKSWNLFVRLIAYVGVLLSSIVVAYIVASLVAIMITQVRVKLSANRLFPEANRTENNKNQHTALACYIKDTGIWNIITNLRFEGFLMNHYTGEEMPAPDYKLLIMFLTQDFFQNSHLIKQIRKAISENKKIIPIYYSMQPNELPNEYASSLGQFQGIQYNSPEYLYLIKRTMRLNGCWRDIASDFIYSIRKNEVTIKGYVGKRRDIFIPHHIFDSDHVVTNILSFYLKETPKYDDNTEMFIPKTIKKITNSAFSIYNNNENLIYIHVSKDNKSFHSVDGILYETETEKLFYCPKGRSGQLSLPGGIKTVGKLAFHECKIEDVMIPDGVIKIEKEAFWACKSLQSVYIPANLEMIERRAFANCTALQSVFISDGARKIGNYAFVDCKILNSVFIPNSVKKIEKNAFFDCPVLTIHTPAGSYAEKYAQKKDISYKTYTPEKWDNIKQCEESLTLTQ